jgi:hypothetical protein
VIPFSIPSKLEIGRVEYGALPEIKRLDLAQRSRDEAWLACGKIGREMKNA